jgi:hypothetical protein
MGIVFEKYLLLGEVESEDNTHDENLYKAERFP